MSLSEWSCYQIPLCIFTWINKTVFIFIQISMQYSNFHDFYHYKKFKQPVNNCGAGIHSSIYSLQKMSWLEIGLSGTIIIYYFEIINTNFDCSFSMVQSEMNSGNNNYMPNGYWKIILQIYLEYIWYMKFSSVLLRIYLYWL